MYPQNVNHGGRDALKQVPEDNSFGGEFRVHNESFGDDNDEYMEHNNIFEGRMHGLGDIAEENTESESRGPTTRRTPRQMDLMQKEEMLLVETERLLRENNLLKRFEEESARTSERLPRPQSSEAKLAEEVEMEKNEITKMLEEALMSGDGTNLDQVSSLEGGKQDQGLGTTQDLTREVENIFKKYNLREASSNPASTQPAYTKTQQASKASRAGENQENVPPKGPTKPRGIEEVRCSLFQESQQPQQLQQVRGAECFGRQTQHFPNTDFGDLEFRPRQTPAHQKTTPDCERLGWLSSKVRNCAVGD